MTTNRTDSCGDPSRAKYVRGCRCGDCTAAERLYKRLYRLRASIAAGCDPADVWRNVDEMPAGGDV